MYTRQNQTHKETIPIHTELLTRPEKKTWEGGKRGKREKEGERKSVGVLLV